MKAEIGVIFDMDGVIMDNNPYHKKAWKTFCETHNVPLTDEELHNHVFGRIAKDTIDYIFKKDHSIEDVDRYVNEKEEVYREMYRNKISLVDGLQEFLEELGKNDVPAAIATSAPRDNVEFVFNHLPIRKYFEFVLDASDIKKGKPDPEIYEKSITKLGMKPKQCLVFEDSLSGVQAAFDSGAHVMALSTTHEPEEFQNVIGIMKNFCSIDYEMVKSLIIQGK